MAEDLGQSRACTPEQVTIAANFHARLAISASLPDARHHQAASSTTQLRDIQLTTLPADDLCKCCKLPYKGKGYRPFSLCTNREELAEFGLGFPLLFLVMKCLMGMLLVVLGVASIPNLVQNLHAGRQEEFGPKSQIAGTSVGGNGDIDSDLDYWPAILNLVALFLICGLYVYLWALVRRAAAKLYECSNTPADYTIVFKNLGTEWSSAELKAHIETNMTTHGITPSIEEISTSYGTREYIRQLDTIARLNIMYRRTVAAEQGQLPMERPCRCCCCCISKGSKMTIGDYEKQLDKCKKELNLLAQSVSKTGIAFVSLSTQDQVSSLLYRWKGRGIGKYFPCCQHTQGNKFKGRSVQVKRAPEPTDIIWENLIYSRTSRILRTLVTTALLAAILCCSFFILYGLAKWQKDLYDNLDASDREKATGKKQSSTEFSSIPPAIIIFIFNLVLDKTIRVMSVYEHRHSYTDQVLSTSWKLTIVMSLNTLLFPLLAHANTSEWYTPGGLANNIFWVAISAAFVRPLFKLCDPYKLWKHYRRWDVKKVIENQSAYISQGQANLIYQHYEVDVAAWYADIMIKFLLCLAYTPLLPLIVPIILLGLAMEYWIDKWILLRQSCRPKFLNKKIALFMINFVKPALVLYGISILIFFPDINKDTRGIGIAAVILALVFWLLHSGAYYLSRKCFKKPIADPEFYSSASQKFTTVSLI